ncbi:MAG: PA14 domain-containing protein, partial [Akkermansiaceae bacterium]
MRLWLLLGLLSVLPALGNRGAEIYTQHCTSCHGDQGQGVADEYDEALVGKKSIASLAKYIHRTMPEEDEDAVIDEDARLVAEYIHKSFYSPEAQARLKPVRKDLLRRTQHQHRRAITDIVQSFRNRAWMGDEHGLRGHYFNKEKMNNRKKALVKRVDPTIDFDVHKKHGVEELNAKAHSIFWTGSILPPETGEYGFRLKSPNGVRIFLNEPNQKKDAFIDAWVSSGNQMRTVEKNTFLLGGHAVPIFIDFVCYKEEKSSLLIEWKPPHGTWEPIPSKVLYTADSQKAAIISTPFPADDASLGYERG